MRSLIDRARSLFSAGAEPTLPNPETRVDFFVIGAQKAGTTALYSFLARHPRLQMSEAKEPHFFDRERIDWRRPDYHGLHTQFDWDAADVLRGEATPIYIYWPEALSRLAAYRPDAKLILGLRHPALRAYSHWRMESGRGDEEMSFEDAISLAGRKRVEARGQRGLRVHSYVERGFYGAQIKALLTLFPREALYVFRTDDLWLRPGAVLRDIEDFLGVEPLLAADAPAGEYIVPLQSATVGAMPAAARAALDALYADDLTEAERLTGLDLSDWRDPAYAEPMKG
ncbi:MAG: sulfotransferase domain-containing protein [Pseudomonadota bacterium]